MRSTPFKKLMVVGLLLFLVFAPVLGTAHAASQTPPPNPPSPWKCISNTTTCAVYYVGVVVDEGMALAVMGTAWLVRLGLQFNDNIFNAPGVQTGFSIALALANLGFVLGIIIIAIATILRKQTYGIKQLLWKLVAMAVLVNFGLVITGPIVGFADSLSQYFVSATSPSVTTGGYEGYVTAMTTAFSPQTANTPSNTTDSGKIGCDNASADTTLAALCKIVKTNQAPPADAFTEQVLALFFGIAMLGLTAFTFLCLAALLIIRYLMLTGLLIVLPFAWLMYIFPKFDNNFSKWWNIFIKWTFFPPLALFFIYLAFITATNVNGAANAYLEHTTGIPAGATNGPEAGLAYETGLTGPIQQGADEIVLVGLTLMGLMFASSLSGKAGSTVVNGVTHGGAAFAGYVGKKSKKGARSAIQKAGGDTAVKNLKSGFGGRLQKVPVVGWAASRATSKVGRVVEPHLSNKEYIDKAKTKVPENPESIKQNLKGNMSKDDRLAHIATLVEKGELEKGTMIGDKTVAEFLDENADAIAVNGLGKMQNDANKVLGSNKEMREAAKKLKEAKNNGTGVVEAEESLRVASNAFVAKLEKSDMGKVSVNSVFEEGGKDPLAAAFMDSMITTAPHLASGLVKKMKSKTLKDFTSAYNERIKEARDKSANFSHIDTLNEELEKLEEAKKGENPALDELTKKKDRLNVEIGRVNDMVGDKDWKIEQIRRRKERLAGIDDAITNIKDAEGKDKKLIQEKIDKVKSAREVIMNNLTEEENNIERASKSFKALLVINATGGHEDHEGGSSGSAEHSAH